MWLIINFIIFLWMIGFFMKIQFSLDIVYHDTTSKNINPWILLFASEEKTEDPTPKKLQDARKKGQAAKSVDLISVIILLAVTLLIGVTGDILFSKSYKFLSYSLRQDMNLLFTQGNIFNLFMNMSLYFFQITAPIFSIVMIVAIMANFFQTGFIPSTDPLKPNLNKLNPIEGFKRIFSKRAIFDFSKTFFKLIVCGLTAYNFIKDNLKNIFSITQMGLLGIFPYFKDIVEGLMLRIAFVLGVLAVIDFMYQKYEFKKNLKMTKQEIKEEFKQMEGDPQIKSLRKQKQRQLAMSRMMEEVPKATVIITNPTHLSVALKYDKDQDEAPMVVAKGADFIAMKIREIAKGKDIPIIENKPLAQVLYKKVETGSEIPVTLYQAVAEILAIVYQMKEKRKYI